MENKITTYQEQRCMQPCHGNPENTLNTFSVIAQSLEKKLLKCEIEFGSKQTE